ncbi:MAG: response regulator [Pirellulaceae bacterium]|nr:response regulator [Pirellulaceae bacterium]
MNPASKLMRVLVVDDDEVTAAVLEHSLIEFGYDVTVAHNGREAFQLIRSGEIRMVVSDWCMPEMSGLELCRRIRERSGGAYVYIIMLTSNSRTQDVVEGLNAGADDYITKPFQPEELQVRLRVGERVLSLESRDLTIFALAKLAESRDPDTGAHLERIREYCRIMAQELVRTGETGEDLDGDFVHMMYLTSPLHDIGKVGIPDQILLKPGALTDDETEIMRRHTVIGGETLDALVAAHPEARFLLLARDIAWTHHERYDGSGYPRGLAGRAIPLCGRIAALADVYDALTSKRVYKDAMSHEAAREVICEGRGSHFDPRVVDAFLRRDQDFHRLQRALADPPTPVAALS